MKSLCKMKLIVNSDTIQQGGQGFQTPIEKRMVWMRYYAWYWKPERIGAGPSQRMGRDNQPKFRRQMPSGLPREDSQVVIPNMQTRSEQTPTPSVSQREASSASNKPQSTIDTYSPTGVAAFTSTGSSLKTDEPDRPARKPSEGTRKVSFANTISTKSTAKPQQKDIKNWRAPFVVDS